MVWCSKLELSRGLPRPPRLLVQVATTAPDVVKPETIAHLAPPAAAAAAADADDEARARAQPSCIESSAPPLPQVYSCLLSEVALSVLPH